MNPSSLPRSKLRRPMPPQGGVRGDSRAGLGKLRGYLVSPPSGREAPTVLVVHENRGLNPHIEDIARRLALDNFIAFAPDALFPLGGYPGDEDKAREMFQNWTRPRPAKTSSRPRPI